MTKHTHTHTHTHTCTQTCAEAVVRNFYLLSLPYLRDKLVYLLLTSGVLDTTALPSVPAVLQSVRGNYLPLPDPRIRTLKLWFSLLTPQGGSPPMDSPLSSEFSSSSTDVGSYLIMC